MSEQQLELAIIGGGPAALSAALYASRAGLRATVFERGAVGGVLTQIAQIENYPGFIGTGAELADTMRRQAVQAGAKVEYGECTSVLRHEQGFILQIDGAPRSARAVIAATGSKPRSLELSLDVSVSYCALCDSSFAREKRVAVVGGGNSAFQEALHLIELVKSLTLITHSRVKADPWLVQRLLRYPNVEIREQLEPTAELLNQFEYVFVFIGKRPATDMFRQLDQELRQASSPKSPSQEKPQEVQYPEMTRESRHELQNHPQEQSAGQVSSNNLVSESYLLDSAGYLIAPENRAALAGLFAAGDVRAGALHQAVVAAADGASAALAAKSYLQNL